jgi:nucleoid-associated protein
MKFIIHELLKDVNQQVHERYREALIEPSVKEQDFVSNVTRLFRRHQSGRVYGNFESDTNSYPFKRLLTECIDSGDFYSFSKASAAHLVSVMGAIPAATGGYYFAAQFDDESVDTMLVFMLSQRTGHAVDKKTLTLQNVLNLQMEHLDLAAHINITDWKADKPEPVSLVRGRKEVSDYFKRFIGLHEPRTNTEATKKLKQFIDVWMEDHRYSAIKREEVRDHVLEYSKNSGGQPVELRVIASLVDAERADEFFDKANAAGLGAEFHIDRRCLTAWQRAVYQDEDIKLSLAKRQLHKRFIYNAKEKTLLLKNIVFTKEDLA